jgi:hypothetical protein
MSLASTQKDFGPIRQIKGLFKNYRAGIPQYATKLLEVLNIKLLTYAYYLLDLFTMSWMEIAG